MDFYETIIGLQKHKICNDNIKIIISFLSKRTYKNIEYKNMYNIVIKYEYSRKKYDITKIVFCASCKKILKKKGKHNKSKLHKININSKQKKRDIHKAIDLCNFRLPCYEILSKTYITNK